MHRRPVAGTRWIAALAAVVLFGCTSAKPLKPVQLGTVGIVTAARGDAGPRGGRPIPGAGAGATRGARVSAEAMVETGITVVGSVPPIGIAAGLVIIILAPVGAGVGATAGALGADSAEEVESADSTLRAVLARLHPADAVRTQLREVLHKHSLRTVVLVDLERVVGRKDFTALGEDGIETILELHQITVSLSGPDFPERALHPKHKFRMEIKTRLLRPDGSPLHEDTFVARQSRSFVDWAAHDARALRATMDRATRELVEDIVNRYLLTPVLVDADLSPLPVPRPSTW